MDWIDAEIRAAMLKAATKWQDEADGAESMTHMTVARVIAEAFRKEADEYRKPRPTLDITDDRPLVDDTVVADVDEAEAFDAHDTEDARWKPASWVELDETPKNLG